MAEDRGESRIETLLSQLSHAANLGVPPEELLTRAADGLMQVARARAGLACLVNPETKGLEVVSVRGIRPGVARSLPRAVSPGPVNWSRPIRIGDARFPGLEELHATLAAEGVTGGILLPLGREGQLLAVLVAMFRAGDEPPALPDAALERIQGQLSTALYNARVRHGLQAVNADLLRLLTLAKILGEPRELEDTLTMVAQSAQSFSGAVATAVWLADPPSRTLRRIVMLGGEGGSAGGPTTFAYGEGVPGRVVVSGEPLYVEDAPRDPRVQAKEWVARLGVRAIYAFPLRFDGEPVGVLSVGSASPLSSSQLSLFETFCDHAALAIGHARLLRSQEIHAEQLRRLVAAAQAVNAGRPPRALLGLIAEACRRATGASRLWVWRANGRARALSLVWSDPPEPARPPRRGSAASGLAVATARARRPRVAADLADAAGGDAEWYRRRGVRAGAALPLMARGRLLGVLELGARGPLGEEQVRLGEAYAALAASALARGR
jgi:GAF domain-containing protein